MKQRDMKREGDREREAKRYRQTDKHTDREIYVMRGPLEDSNIPSPRKFAGRKYAFFVKVRIWRERGVINDSPYPR